MDEAGEVESKREGVNCKIINVEIYIEFFIYDFICKINENIFKNTKLA